MYSKDLGFQPTKPMLQPFQLGNQHPKVSRFTLYPDIINFNVNEIIQKIVYPYSHIHAQSGNPKTEQAFTKAFLFDL